MIRMIEINPRYEEIFKPDNIDQDCDGIANPIGGEGESKKDRAYALSWVMPPLQGWVMSCHFIIYANSVDGRKQGHSLGVAPGISL